MRPIMASFKKRQHKKLDHFYDIYFFHISKLRQQAQDFYKTTQFFVCQNCKSCLELKMSSFLRHLLSRGKSRLFLYNFVARTCEIYKINISLLTREGNFQTLYSNFSVSWGLSLTNW